MKKVYINLIGTDGSGKTSISESLVEKLGDQCEMIWCGAESVLMKPIRSVLGMLTKSKKEDELNKAYKSDVAKKQKIASTSRLLTKLYIEFVLFDYWLQYKLKMWRTRHVETVVLDRYFFDVALNLAIRLGWNNDELIGFIEKRLHLFHLPDVRVWVKVSAEISMQRKDDIPDISYIQLRLGFYQIIAERFGFLIIDGTEGITKNANFLVGHVSLIKDKKHILYVHSNNEDIGGADFCMYRLAKEFKEKGYVTTAALRLDSDVIKDYRATSIPVFNKKFSRPQLSRGVISILLLPFKSLLDVIYFLKLFKVQLPDVVHVNDLYDFAPAIAAKLLSIKVVYHIRMIRINRYEKVLFGFLVDSISTYSVSVSTPVRDYYFKDERFLKSKHVVIYDWPNDVMLDEPNVNVVPKGILEGPLCVVMVGRLEEWKGQHVFLDAVKKVNEHGCRVDVHFYLIGGGVVGASKEAYSSKIIEQVENMDNVTYLGARNDVPDILRFADISVHSSTTPDPFPGVVLESLLSASATIGARAGGVVEMIREREDGLLFEPSNAEELSEKINELIKSKELRLRLSESGRHRIIEMTNKNKLLRLFANLYESEI